MSSGDRRVVVALATLAVVTVVALLWLTLISAPQWVLFVVLLASLVVTATGAYWFVFVPGGRRGGRRAARKQRGATEKAEGDRTDQEESWRH